MDIIKLMAFSLLPCWSSGAPRKRDSLWSWLVCVCATMTWLASLGFLFSFGIFLPVFMDYFNASRETTGSYIHGNRISKTHKFVLILPFSFIPPVPFTIENKQCRPRHCLGGQNKIIVHRLHNTLGTFTPAID